MITMKLLCCVNSRSKMLFWVFLKENILKSSAWKTCKIEMAKVKIKFKQKRKNSLNRDFCCEICFNWTAFWTESVENSINSITASCKIFSVIKNNWVELVIYQKFRFWTWAKWNALDELGQNGIFVTIEEDSTRN